MSEPQGARGKIYIAGSSQETDRVQKWIAEIRAAGYVVTLDWTLHVLAFKALGRLPTDEEAKPAAIGDMEAVLTADIVWVLRPTTNSTGVHTEIGLALGWNQALERCAVDEDRLRVIASGGDGRNIFTTLADHVFATDEEAFEHITNW